jgi:hypothetical protein
MKKLVMLVAFITLMATGVSAVDNISFGAGYTTFLQSGQVAKSAYSVRMNIPIVTISKGTKITSIDKAGVSVKETYPTLNVINETDVMYGGFDNEKKMRKLQAELSTLKVQKTLGVWTLYASGGIAGLHISQTNTEDAVAVGWYDGYAFSIGMEPIEALKIDLGGYVFPLYDVADLFAIQARVNYSFSF